MDALTLKYWFPDLETRHIGPELMDDANTSSEEIIKTYKHFEIINLLFSRIRTLARQYIVKDIKRRNLQEVTILDIGCGGGDFAFWFYDLCYSMGIQTKIICLDYDIRAINYAKQKTGNRKSIEFVCGDAHNLHELNLKAHYITANHFLHHVPNENISTLIEQIYSAASCGILVNDILRTYIGFLAFTIFGRFFLNGGFTRTDGRISIQRGFRKYELNKFVHKAGLTNHLYIDTIFPSHIFIFGTKP